MKDTEAFAVVAGQVALIGTLEGCREYAETRARRDFGHLEGVTVQPVVIISAERYDALQKRVDELEGAIREHRDQGPPLSVQFDFDERLWSHIESTEGK